MNKLRFWRGLLLCLGLACLPPRVAAEESPPPRVEEEYLPGVTLSQGITQITGVAISPLLGVSGVGAWHYWKASSADRPALPWYCQPWAWGSGFVLLALCFLKDTLGTAVPGLLKKPFDMLELFEDKLSALVASGAFVPLVANQMANHFKAAHPEPVLIPSAALFGASSAGLDLAWLLVPLAILAFLLVWLCSHAINVLIVLSPFSTLDAALKLTRTSLLAVVGLVYLIAPWVAALFCLALIALAAWMAPSAMRLAIFGARYALDILLPGRGRRRATPGCPHAFTLGSWAGLPPRTGGRLVLLEDGTAAFRYRRWCIRAERTIPIPEGVRHVERGILAPSLVHRGTGKGGDLTLFVFLPRYRGHEEAMANCLRFHGTRDHALARGFAAFKRWLGSIFRRRGRDSSPV